MAVKIGVLAKQVIDPEMPMAAFRIDEGSKKVVPPPNIPPVVNGFDENAVEAALKIKDSQEATVTVMFADLSGFTTLSTQIPPNMLVARTTQYLASIVHQVEATGGWVNQFLGDCVMAIWGAPVLDSHHAPNAVRAACGAVKQVGGERSG